MFKRILVPLDGSSRAERAIPVAARIARASGGSVIMMRVAPVPIDYAVYIAPSPMYIQETLDAELNEANSYLAGIATSSDLADIKVETSVYYGAAAQTILSVTESYNVDLIVMCSHGNTGFRRWIMGSVTERVLGATQLPLLIVRPQEAESKQELNGEDFAAAGIGGIHMGSGLF